jgi:hypothetical protein
MSSINREPTKYAFYQILIYLAWPFQRRFFLEINQLKQEWPVVAMFVNGSKLNQQPL